jgi:hypothetical protein
MPYALRSSERKTCLEEVVQYFNSTENEIKYVEPKRKKSQLNNFTRSNVDDESSRKIISKKSFDFKKIRLAAVLLLADNYGSSKAQKDQKEREDHLLFRKERTHQPGQRRVG